MLNFEWIASAQKLAGKLTISRRVSRRYYELQKLATSLFYTESESSE